MEAVYFLFGIVRVKLKVVLTKETDVSAYMFVPQTCLQQDNSAVIKLTWGAGAGARIWADTHN